MCSIAEWPKGYCKHGLGVIALIEAVGYRSPSGTLLHCNFLELGKDTMITVHCQEILLLPSCTPSITRSCGAPGQTSEVDTLAMTKPLVQ